MQVNIALSLSVSLPLPCPPPVTDYLVHLLESLDAKKVLTLLSIS